MTKKKNYKKSQKKVENLKNLHFYHILIDISL